MSFSAIVNRAWREGRWLSALIELTYDCNWDCVFCYNDRALTGERLQLQKHKALLTELSDLNVLQLTLSGGEPFEYEGLLELGAHAKRLGFMTRIKTNGMTLTPQMIQRVQREIDPFVIEVSLHGADAATHDRQTRRPGSFDTLRDNLAALKEAGQRTKINSTITKWNASQLEAMQTIATSVGAGFQVDATVKPNDSGDTRATALQAPRTQKPAAPIHDGIRPNCGAGFSTLAIDPVGNVYPCVAWRRNLGQWKEYGDLITILKNNPQLDGVRSDNRQYGQTPREIGFCPGEYEQGDRTNNSGKHFHSAAKKIMLPIWDETL